MKVIHREFGTRFKIGYFKTLFIILKNIYLSKNLIFQLFKRDLNTVNKRTYLGFLWNILSPLFGIVSWLIIQMAGVLKPGDIGISFPLYILAGTVVYNYFGLFITAARTTLSSGGSFIMQVSYPHESLWAYNLVSALFWSFFSLAFNLIIFIAFGIYPRLEWLFLPFLMIPLFFLGSSIGFLLLVFDKAIPDLSKIIDMVIPLLYWVTPIIYTITAVENEFILFLIQINPLYYIVTVPRDLFLFGTTNLWWGFSLISFFSFFLFLICLRVYYVMEEIIVERI